MIDQFRHSIVRIKDNSGSIIGAGFLIDNKTILTCAHVISNALGVAKSHQRPESCVYIDFPLLESGESSNILKSHVVFWSPENEKDIAGLELDDQLPKGAQYVSLVDEDRLWGHLFRVFGFPMNYDNGVWASGVFRDKEENGWMQIEDVKEQGHRVEEGFSGSPVWDEYFDALVGMVVATDTKPGNKVAFLIPINTIFKVFPELKARIELDDPWRLIKEELKILMRKSEYKPFRLLLDGIQNYVGRYQPDVLDSLIYIVKNLELELEDNRNFKEVYEYLSMGQIPAKWEIDKIIKPDNYDILIKLIIHLFGTKRKKLETKLDLGIPLPIVLIVMNEREADELSSGTAFTDYPSKLFEDFRRLEELLTGKGLGKWKEAYRNDLRLWQPFLPAYSETIEQLILNAIEILNIERQPIPIFMNIHDINKESYRIILKKFRGQGSVVIVDAISMQHPNIQREFRRSLLDAFPNTLVVKIGPIRDALEFSKQMALILEIQSDLEFYKRFQIDRDEKCKSVCKVDELDKWLFQQTPKLPLIKPNGRSLWWSQGN